MNSSTMRVDFQLSRESLLLNLLKQGCRYGQGVTTEVLFFLFWLASGTSNRVVSGMPHYSLHYRVTEDVVAFHHQVSHLPQTPEDRDVMAHGFTGLVQSFWAALIFYATGTANCSPLLRCRWFVTIRAASSARMWASLGLFITPGCPLYRQPCYLHLGHFILTDGRCPCLQHPFPLITPFKRPD